MKHIPTILITAVLAVLITSCATVSPNQKKLVGTWRPEKVEKYDLKNPQADVTGTEETTKSTAVETAKPGEESVSKEVTPEQARAETELRRMIDTQRRSIVTLNADKTFIQDYHGKKIEGTWKLKKRGTRLQSKSKETGRQITMNIESLTDTTAVFTTEFPVGGMKIWYKKMK